MVPHIKKTVRCNRCKKNLPHYDAMIITQINFLVLNVFKLMALLNVLRPFSNALNADVPINLALLSALA